MEVTKVCAQDTYELLLYLLGCKATELYIRFSK